MRDILLFLSFPSTTIISYKNQAQSKVYKSSGHHRLLRDARKLGVMVVAMSSTVDVYLSLNRPVFWRCFTATADLIFSDNSLSDASHFTLISS